MFIQDGLRTLVLSLLSLTKLWFSQYLVAEKQIFNVVKQWVVSGFAAELDLSVISLTVKVQFQFPNDMSKDRQTTKEGHGAED